MSSNGETIQPFKNLGVKIRLARVRLQESVADVSGAIEIDTETLRKIERGEQPPSEEILLLLISYLDINDTDAVRLWQLAGYQGTPYGATAEETDTATALMPLDLRVVYTDGVHIAKNDFGVVMNFLQSTGFGQPLAIARVGMSKNHAEQVLALLQKVLATPDSGRQPKILPSTSTQPSQADER